jgi:hypothetical protein
MICYSLTDIIFQFAHCPSSIFSFTKHNAWETGNASFSRQGKYLLWWAPYLDLFAQ